MNTKLTFTNWLAIGVRNALFAVIACAIVAFCPCALVVVFEALCRANEVTMPAFAKMTGTMWFLLMFRAWLKGL
jgi:flagellar biosynthesis protein FliQ